MTKLRLFRKNNDIYNFNTTIDNLYKAYVDTYIWNPSQEIFRREQVHLSNPGDHFRAGLMLLPEFLAHKLYIEQEQEIDIHYNSFQYDVKNAGRKAFAALMEGTSNLQWIAQQTLLPQTFVFSTINYMKIAGVTHNDRQDKKVAALAQLLSDYDEEIRRFRLTDIGLASSYSLGAFNCFDDKTTSRINLEQAMKLLGYTPMKDPFKRSAKTTWFRFFYKEEDGVRHIRVLTFANSSEEITTHQNVTRLLLTLLKVISTDYIKHYNPLQLELHRIALKYTLDYSDSYGNDVINKILEFYTEEAPSADQIKTEFDTQYENKKASMRSSIQSSIDMYKDEIKERLSLIQRYQAEIKEKQIYLNGYDAQSDEMREDLFNHLYNGEPFVHFELQGNLLHMAIKRPLTNYDHDEAEAYIRRSHYLDTEILKKAAKRLFLGHRYAINGITGIVVDIVTGNLSSSRRENEMIEQYSRDNNRSVMGNPHIVRYDCFGTTKESLHRQILEDAFNETSLDLIAASAGNLNFSDGAVSDTLMDYLKYDRVNDKMIIDYETNEMVSFNDIMEIIKAETDAEIARKVAEDIARKEAERVEREQEEAQNREQAPNIESDTTETGTEEEIEPDTVPDPEVNGDINPF